MEIGAFFRDYGTPFALAIASLNTIISLVIGQDFKDSPRARIILVATSAALVAVGVGSSFYSAHEVASSSAKQIQQRLVMKTLLGSAIKEGESLVTKQRTDSEDDVKTYKNDAEAWATNTDHLIDDAYGQGEAELFVNNAGISMYSTPGHPSGFTKSWMSARIQRLNELMPRVDTVSMLPNFDPNKYQPK
jgi:hypothetical protein